jgi:hypothetical protein
MPLTTQASPLVGGAPAGQSGAISVRVIRAFLVRGERAEPGSIVELPASVAHMVLHNGQAEPAPVAPPAAPPIAAPEPTARKERRHAR